MSLQTLEECVKCGTETYFVDGVCIHCAKQEAEKQLQDWQNLPIEVRLLDIYKRLLILEQGPRRHK